MGEKEKNLEPKESVLDIQNESLKLDSEEENSGVGYEIVISSEEC